MIEQKFVNDFYKQYKNGEIILNKDRIDLMNWLEEKVLAREEFYFDETNLNGCIKFIEKWFFKLQPFQKFLIAFIFLKYKETDKIVFNVFFWTMARGAGKNGIISALAMYFISPLNSIKRYNIGVVATSEDQAKTSFEEVYDVIDDNREKLSPERKKNQKVKPKRHYEYTKTKITGVKNKSWFKFYTSNAKTKDGARLGAIIFDEIHEFVDNSIVEVFTSGLGKRKHSREFYIGTNGFVRDGVYDDMVDRARKILRGEIDDFTMFPWICTIDELSEVHDEKKWEKANPMFHHPISEYGETLLDEVKRGYNNTKQDGGDMVKFIIKRMNFADIEGPTDVAKKEDIRACNVLLPDLRGLRGVGTLDYAQYKDFAACGFMFEDEYKYFWDTYSFVRKEFLDTYPVKAPIYEWERRGLLEVLDEPSIDVRKIVEYFIKGREKYGVNTIIIDRYKEDLVRPALEDAGFEVIIVFKSKAIAAGVGQSIQKLFSERRLNWGENPLMNWYTANVKVTHDKFENIDFGKKERIRRKTDGFMAMVLGYWGLRGEEREYVENFYLHELDF